MRRIRYATKKSPQLHPPQNAGGLPRNFPRSDHAERCGALGRDRTSCLCGASLVFRDNLGEPGVPSSPGVLGRSYSTRFYRADRATSRDRTGLGLRSQCTFDADGHHGEIEVNSQVTRASTFPTSLKVSARVPAMTLKAET